MDINDYTAKYAAQYQGQGQGWFERVLVAARRQQVFASLNAYPHRSLLEVGCGLEPLFTYWTEFDRCTIVEPSSEFVAKARAAAPAGVEVFKGFLEDVVSEIERHAPFDFVVLSSLLHEVPDAPRLLATVRRLCSTATVVHVNVPNVYSFHRLLALEMGAIRDLFEQSETEKKFQRHTRFDRATLNSLLERCGFEVLRFGTYFVKPFTHAQMELLIDSGTLEHRALKGLERMTKYLPEMGCEMFAEVRPQG